MNNISTRNLGLIFVGFIVLMLAILAGFKFITPRSLAGTLYDPSVPRPDFTLEFCEWSRFS